MEEAARLIGDRLRSIGASQALAPVLDITRDPRWGRLEETYGEDPYLAAELGCAYVRGVQSSEEGGDGPSSPRLSTWSGTGSPRGASTRRRRTSDRAELHDAFLFPFEAAVREAGIGSVMHAYDDLDGLPCAASRELLTTTLRERSGIEGIVVADYRGIEHLLVHHEMVGDLSGAATMTLWWPGWTWSCRQERLRTPAPRGAGRRPRGPSPRRPGGGARPAHEAAARSPRTTVRGGLPDPDDLATEREAAVALELARRSVVLLANDGTLPLEVDLPRIAVIGPNADDARNLVGDYGHIVHIETLLENRGREGVAGATVPLDLQVADELAGWPTVLAAIRARVAAQGRGSLRAGLWSPGG